MKSCIFRRDDAINFTYNWILTRDRGKFREDELWRVYKVPSPSLALFLFLSLCNTVFSLVLDDLLPRDLIGPRIITVYTLLFIRFAYWPLSLSRTVTEDPCFLQ